MDAGASSRRLSFALTSGMAFPTLDYPIRADRIAAVGCRSDLGECKLRTGRRGAHALVMHSDLDAASGGVVWVDLAPKTLILGEAKVAEYFEEIDASPAVRTAWLDTPRPKRWREIYIKHAKSLVAGRTRVPKSWSTPVGAALEFVASIDTDTRIGTTATFHLLADGARVPGFAVGVVGAGGAKPKFLHTDTDGEIQLRLDRAGTWLVRATRLQPPARVGQAWRSHFATLSFEVR